MEVLIKLYLGRVIFGTSSNREVDYSVPLWRAIVGGSTIYEVRIRVRTAFFNLELQASALK